MAAGKDTLPPPHHPDWTLVEAVRLAEARSPFEDGGYTFFKGDGSSHKVTFPELRRRAEDHGKLLLERGLSKGDRAGLIVPDPEDFVVAFLGAISAGVVPVPLYPPLGFGKLDAYVDSTERILTKAGARLLVTSKKVQPVLWSLVDRVATLEELACTEELNSATPDPDTRPEPVAPEDPCFLQFTSGSTALPKGVVVTHRSLGENAWAILSEGLEVDPAKDRCLSWLPLYHDMGLIGFVLTPLMIGLDSCLIPTLRFLTRPTCWMQAMHDHRATLTFAPNFGYGLATRRTSDEKVRALDLSHVRVLGAGAEPNHPGTLGAFMEHFAPAGLRPSALMPVYGMAEATLAMAFCGLSDEMKVDRVRAEPFADEGRAEPEEQGGESDSDEAAALSFVCCGRTFKGHEIIIADDEGEPLPERAVGEIVFRGPSLTPGYFEDPEKTAAAFTERGLRTGDLGYLAGGELYVTGRKKDLIILNGRNYDPASIEWAVAEIDGARRGNVVAFSIPGTVTEELVVVAEARPKVDREALRDAIIEHLREDLVLSPKDVLLVDKGSLPKTTSGKLQRAKTRKAYLDGTLGAEGDRTAGGKGPALTVAKHVAASLVSRGKHAVRKRMGS